MTTSGSPEITPFSVKAWPAVWMAAELAAGVMEPVDNTGNQTPVVASHSQFRPVLRLMYGLTVAPAVQEPSGSYSVNWLGVPTVTMEPETGLTAMASSSTTRMVAGFPSVTEGALMPVAEATTIAVAFGSVIAAERLVWVKAVWAIAEPAIPASTKSERNNLLSLVMVTLPIPQLHHCPGTGCRSRRPYPSDWSFSTRAGPKNARSGFPLPFPGPKHSRNALPLWAFQTCRRQ